MGSSTLRLAWETEDIKNGHRGAGSSASVFTYTYKWMNTFNLNTDLYFHICGLTYKHELMETLCVISCIKDSYFNHIG